ncbi:MAG: hypothetical protein ACFB2Y_16800 [Fulvivirga sp.]
MSIKIYKVTANKPEGLGGAAFFLFKDERLLAVNWEFTRTLNDHEAAIVTKAFPLRLSDLSNLKKVFKVREIPERTASDKLKLFCMYFKAKRGSTYTANKFERANIKNVVMNSALLEAYFSTDSYPLTYAKTINDYIKHYNHIRDISRNGAPKKARFPNEYNKDFERRLEGAEISQYWKHLTNLGWKKNAKGVWISPEKLAL